ncbi:carbohydrate ABC transporter permease [Clostridium estertheticum]|uniref:carbohydrate ABC transporter permease n=1 Tax=Clostridium estertheticum TaxID=238834 RepID=UPI001C0C94A1|nr:carbohydrate ABC transporter permease [Clostridium estertheticum]MBU3177407.1 carbohydrate ABC transporter permease [Clostridium estertheticum]
MNDKFSFKKGYRGRAFFKIFNAFFLLATVVVILVPLLKVVSDSLDATGSYGLRLIPLHPTLAAYKAVVTQTTLYTPFLISVYITILGTLIGLLLTTLGAYILVQDDMPGRKLLASLLFFTMLFNGGLVPTYLNMKSLGLMNSLWSIILPLSLNVYNLILMKSFFEGIPKALMEAAEIDGCSPMGIFVKIVLPLSKPALAAIGLFFAVSFWNEYFNFMLYISDPNKLNFQIKIREMIIESTTTQSTASSGIYSKTLQNAAIIVTILPFAAIYPFCQKYFVQGITLGGVKG